MKRVFIYDDEPMTSEVRTVLETAGYAVVGIAPALRDAGEVTPFNDNAGPLGPQPRRSRTLESELDRRLLLRLGEVMHGSADSHEVLATVSTELGRYLAASRCNFLQVDVAADQVILLRGYNAGVPSLPGIVSLSTFGHENALLSARGETLVVEDARSDRRTAAHFAASYERIGTRAVVVVPLMRDGRWVGALSVSSSSPRVWREREIGLIRLVAERTWLWLEHVRIEADLRRSHARFDTFVDDIKEYAIFMLDAAGNIATWNSGAERLTGYRADEVIGRSQSVFYPTGDAPRAQAVLDSAVRSGRYEEEGWRIRKDGSRFWASVVMTPTFHRDGSIEGFAKVTRDFTDRRRHEEDLRLQQANLAQRLKEREALVQEIDHRVKNNLQVITSLINMQMRKLAPGPARDALSECRARVLAIAFTHEQLYRAKDYARIRFGDYLHGLVQHLLHANATSAEHVVLDLAITDLPLAVDRAIPCALVINELISNALRHGFAGERRGTIRVELAALGEDRVRLSVRDDGVGLPPGFDIRNVTSMGLQLVSTLAEQLEATLAVTRDGGTGVELTFAAGPSPA